MKLTNSEYIAFRKQVKETLQEFPMLRKGQVMFNVLYEIRQDIAEKVRSTDLDPFYDDNKIPQFIKYISE